MFRVWIAVMRENGVYTKTNECTWTSTHEFPGQVEADETGETVNRTSKEDGFKALDAKKTMVGDDNAELSHRLHRAWQALYKHKYIFVQQKYQCEKKTSSHGMHNCTGNVLGSRVLEFEGTRRQEVTGLSEHNAQDDCGH